MKRQPSDLITWEELEKMTPKVDIQEIKPTETPSAPTVITDPGAFKPRKDRPRAQLL